MTYLTPKIIAEVTDGIYIGSASGGDIRVAGAVRDNRDAKQGNLFVCIRGEHTDGHLYANAAFESGASCCLAEQTIDAAKGPYVLVDSTLDAVKKLAKHYRSLFSIPIIGVTGSVGKTTTKEMISAALMAKLNALKTQENMNNELGVALTLLSMDEAHEAAVVEMGISDFGEMSRLAEMVRPNICVMTKIGYSHIENLGDLGGVLKAKSEVFRYMPPDGIAILNGDDELLRGYDPGLGKITFGLGEYNDYCAGNFQADGFEGITFDIVSEAGRFAVTIPSYGSHLPMAAVAAAAVGRLLGLSDIEIAQGLFSYSPIGGRSNIIDTGHIRLIDDCYNSNPNSVMAALTSISALPGRRVAILGDMLELGSESELLHREIGVFAADSGVDSLVCCGEKAINICDGYKSVCGGPVEYFADKDALAAAIPGLIKKGDTVLVKASHGMHFESLLPVLEAIH